MRAIALLSFIALFCLPVAANQEDEGVLPFAYVTSNTETRYDLFVMDARSGEALYSVVGEDYDCPYSVSEDRNWLLYSYGRDSRIGANTSMMNLATGEISSIGSLNTHFITGNHDFSQLAYISWHNYNQDSYLDVLEPSSGYTRMLVEEAAYKVELMRFVGDDLLFVMLEDDAIIFNRWDGTSLDTRSFYRRDGQTFGLNISSDGNFLNVLYRFSRLPNVLSVIDTETGNTEDIELPIIGGISSVEWMPNSNSFAYIGDNEAVWFYNALSGEAEEILEYETTSFDGIHILNSSFTNLVWSPDGAYLMATQSFEIGATISLIEMSTGIVRDAIPLGDVWDVQWLSATEFVYDFDGYDEYLREDDFDIFYYNVSTGERLQLTHTDELNETLYCGWG
jgi:hypothetical protein